MKTHSPSKVCTVTVFTEKKHHPYFHLKRIGRVLILFLLLATNFLTPLQSQTPAPQYSGGVQLYEDGKLYMVLKQTTSVFIQNKDTIQNDPNGNFASLFTKYQVTKTDRPFAAFQTPNLIRTYLLSFSQIARIDSFMLDLQAMPNVVEYVEKVPFKYCAIVPNELGTNPTAQAAGLYHLALLNANQASNIFTVNPSSPNAAIVAVVDDAVLTTHEDLSANIGTLNRDVTPNAANASDPNPPLAAGNASNFTHGTHVAGIAGAVTNNSLGVAAIGWNNKLMCVKSTDVSTVIAFGYQGLTWAANNGARVINMSWGSVASSSVEYSAIVAAKSNNVVLVAAAGNGFANTPFYPAAYGEGLTGQPWEVLDRKLVIAVAALDQNSDIGIWGSGQGSNFGNWVDISAYGTNIVSTLAKSATLTGTPINNSYGLLSGTSMAAPMIAGIVGTMRSYNPSKTVDEVYDCLVYTANPDIYAINHPLNQSGKLGTGRADAEAALRCVSSACTANPIVVIVPSSTNLCSSSIVTLQASTGAVSYLWNNSATTQTISAGAPGIYSVVATYSGNCTASASIVISAPPTLSISMQTNTLVCPGSSINIVTAVGNFTSVIWRPGELSTAEIVANPSASTVYTVTANPQCGGTTTTFTINPSGFTQPFNSNQYSVLSSSAISGLFIGPNSNPPPFTQSKGRYLITTNTTININANFIDAEIIFAPSVNITVPNASTLNLNLAYLHTCGADMWGGIIAEDKSELALTNQCMLEDAQVGISSTHFPTFSAGLPPAKIKLEATTFNKNYVDVKLVDYYDLLSPLTLSNSLSVDKCVFTCRNFGFHVSAGNGPLSPGIRTAFSSTTALNTPYTMYGYTFTTLKAPFIGQTSDCAFLIINGSPTNNVIASEIVIGNSGSPADFNLFDNHHVFINAQNSNIKLKNNVFQNQRHSVIQPQNVAINIGPGQINSGWSNNSAAIMHRTFSAALNTTLNLSAANFDVGNRFWDCIRVVEAFNTHTFKMSYGIARSTHTVDGNNIVGTSGLNLKTNRVNYEINHNEFTNIKNAINIPLTAGYIAGSLLNPNSPPIFIYGNNLMALDIFRNEFSAGNISGGNFMNQAINVTNDLNVWPNSPLPLPQLEALLPSYGWLMDPLVFPNSFRPTGLGIIDNKITNAYLGINVNGIVGFPTWLATNAITLAAYPSTMVPTPQYGIQFTNATATSPKQQSVWLNNVRGFGANNPIVSLIYCSLNSGNTSPLVNCNQVKNANKGFVFSGNNIGAQNVSGTQWLGNTMENLKHGMYLEGTLTTQSVMISGVIGQQGSSLVAMGNFWPGNTWTAPNYNIWTQFSQATLSPIYHFGSWSGMSLYGNPLNWNYSWPDQNAQYAIKTNTNQNFYCDWTQNFVQPNSDPTEYNFDGIEAYLSGAQTFHFLRYNQTVRDSSSVLTDWYNWAQNHTNFEALEGAHEKLYSGNLVEAKAMLAALTAQNYVEENTIKYYNLYASYVEDNLEGTAFSEADSSNLVQIAQLCPIEYGASIYEALALYNSIYSINLNSQNCNQTISARPSSILETGNLENLASFHVDIFPSPAGREIVIQSTTANEELKISIFDVTNRLVASFKVQTESYKSTLQLALANGTYCVQVSNVNSQTFAKKLIIIN